MAVILNNKKSTYGSPYCYYTVEYTDTTNRTTTSVDITFKITSHLAYSSSSLGSNYTLKGQLYINGAWTSNITLKPSGESWSGTTPHTKTQTLIISDLSSTLTTLEGIKFKVTSSASDKASGLDATSCSNITIPAGHRSPSVASYSITEQNSALVNIGIPNDTIVENLSIKLIEANYLVYDSATITGAGFINKSTNKISGSIISITNAKVKFSLNCANASFEKSSGKIPIRIYLEDSLNSIGASASRNYTYIPYTPPTIVDSNVVVKRTEQTSGRVNISLNGTYYYGSNLNQGSGYTPTVKYKFWEAGTDEPDTYDYTVPQASITTSGGNYSISNYEIGNTSGSNYFNPMKAYRVKIQVSDNFRTYTLGEAKSVPQGEAVWSEFDDHVDFKAITIQDKEIFYRNIITANAKTAQTLSTTNWTKVPVQLTNSVGDKLEISNDGIKVLSDGYVYVSANILFTSGTTATRRGLSIYKNDTQITYCNIKGDTTYTGASISPLLIPVSANDIIYLYAINQGASGSVISTNDTYLNVEVVQ